MSVVNKYFVIRDEVQGRYAETVYDGGKTFDWTYDLARACRFEKEEYAEIALRNCLHSNISSVKVNATLEVEQ